MALRTRTSRRAVDQSHRHHLVDVIVEENDSLATAVNVASRLEMLAEPGGICVSGAVRDHVGQRLDDSRSRISANRASKYLPSNPRLSGMTKLNLTGPTTGERARRRSGDDNVAKSRPFACLPLVNIAAIRSRNSSPGRHHMTSLRSCRVSATCSSSQPPRRSYTRAMAVKCRRSRANSASITSSKERAKGGRSHPRTVQLITPKPTGTFWAERYDSTLEDIFAIQAR